ncbi:UNVERIFIED_CONTAM: hypothetical protein IGO34_32925 [Salmonella enterica subsp. enterica serovar Weltevreden]
MSKKLAELKSKETLVIEMAVLQLIRHYIKNDLSSWRPMKEKVNAFIKKFSDKEQPQTIINYCDWMASKI